MKKSILTLALVVLGFAAAAQTLEVQSAAQDMRKGYLTKAKASIDKACANDQTKDDPKAYLLPDWTGDEEPQVEIQRPRTRLV